MSKMNINPPPFWNMLKEGRAFFEYIATVMNIPEIPAGDGHPVMVLPGLGTSDTSTGLLRKFLKEKEYRTYGWQQGLNRGYHDFMLERLATRLKYLYNKYGGRKVSLIGWSLGGVFARELSKEFPENVRQVITMGSPFRIDLSVKTNANWIYELLAGHSIEDLAPDLTTSLHETPKVPVTAIYSKTDGIVPWQICIEENEGFGIENIEAPSSHFGFGHNRAVLMAIGDRLAQEEGEWYAFKDTELWKNFFEK